MVVIRGTAAIRYGIADTARIQGYTLSAVCVEVTVRHRDTRTGQACAVKAVGIRSDTGERDVPIDVCINAIISIVIEYPVGYVECPTAREETIIGYYQRRLKCIRYEQTVFAIIVGDNVVERHRSGGK